MDLTNHLADAELRLNTYLETNQQIPSSLINYYENLLTINKIVNTSNGGLPTGGEGPAFGISAAPIKYKPFGSQIATTGWRVFAIAPDGSINSQVQTINGTFVNDAEIIEVYPQSTPITAIPVTHRKLDNSLQDAILFYRYIDNALTQQVYALDGTLINSPNLINSSTLESQRLSLLEDIKTNLDNLNFSLSNSKEYKGCTSLVVSENFNSLTTISNLIPADTDNARLSVEAPKLLRDLTFEKNKYRKYLYDLVRYDFKFLNGSTDFGRTLGDTIELDIPTLQQLQDFRCFTVLNSSEIIAENNTDPRFQGVTTLNVILHIDFYKGS